MDHTHPNQQPKVLKDLRSEGCLDGIFTCSCFLILHLGIAYQGAYNDDIDEASSTDGSFGFARVFGFRRRFGKGAAAAAAVVMVFGGIIQFDHSCCGCITYFRSHRGLLDNLHDSSPLSFTLYVGRAFRCAKPFQSHLTPQECRLFSWGYSRRDVTDQLLASASCAGVAIRDVKGPGSGNVIYGVTPLAVCRLASSPASYRRARKLLLA